MEALQQVEFVYNRQRGRPIYAEFVHRGQPPRYPAFAMQLPVAFMPWDEDQGGVVCFMHPVHQSVLASREETADENANVGVCRCGVVKYGKYFKRNRLKELGYYDVALKVMDKGQLELQHDDVFNEVRVMAQLQPPGFTGVYRSPYFSQWECCSDGYNEYIAMDFAANGSLVMYIKRRLTDYKRFAVVPLVQRMADHARVEATLNAFVAEAMMTEALYIFHGVMQGLAYMHAHNVCHLDLDPCNVVIDANFNPRLIDFGSSEIMTNDGLAGTADRLVKFKPLYVAKEVREHNHHAPPRPGFLGAAADMWSAGVLVRTETLPPYSDDTVGLTGASIVAVPAHVLWLSQGPPRAAARPELAPQSALPRAGRLRHVSRRPGLPHLLPRHLTAARDL
jgi:5'-AMP-activated protein kinase, catalytic alpha subunit